MSGLGFLAWAVLAPIQLPPAMPGRAEKLVVNKVIELPQKPSNAIFQKRLQGPLVPVKKEVVKTPAIAKPRPKPTITWPAISLENIFWSEESSLAVLKINQVKHRCKANDLAGKVLVESIGPETVTVVFQGQSKTLQIDQGPK